METIYEFIAGVTDNSLLDRLSRSYLGKNVLVTGGASFIGSNLAELLEHFGANVIILDDLSSGSKSNFYSNNNYKFINGDLKDIDTVRNATRNAQIVFHLGAVHGGRGFIETYKKEMLVNLSIDNNVFRSASESDVDFVVHASSACAYPIGLQDDETSRNLLSEEMASMDKPNTSFADGVYGWTKLLGEWQLEIHANAGDFRARSARIFTAYGERENESHAAIALCAKALLKADPYPIWGNGQQTRNFTHVADTAMGLLLLGIDERNLKFDSINIGTSEHIKVIDFVSEIFKQLDWQPNEIDFQLDRPTGVASRASDNSKIKNLFGWEPKIPIGVGISRTLDWYSKLPNRPKTYGELERKLSAR
jgi:UDP-glucose 4-epimerase